MSSLRSARSLRRLAIATLAIHAGCHEAPTIQTPPAETGIIGVSNPGTTVCARSPAGLTWCTAADGAGNCRIVRADIAPGTGTGPLPDTGVLVVYNILCERAGKPVDRDGAQRNGGPWLDVRCRPELCMAAPPGLLAWYTFDDVAAGSADDLPNAAPAEALLLHGAASQPGKVLGGLSLDGTSYAQGGAGKNVGTGDFTIALWLRADPSAGNDIVSLLDKRDPAPIRGYHVALYFGEPLVQLADGGINGGWYNYHSGINGLADGAWHFLAVTVERGSQQGVRWYLDGSAAGTIRDPTGRPGSLSSISPLVLGRRSISADGWFKGVLDELQIVNRVLAPAEVRNLWERQVCR